jgi:hypothetical protein
VKRFFVWEGGYESVDLDLAAVILSLAAFVLLVYGVAVCLR